MAVFSRQQLKDIIVDDYFIKANRLSAKWAFLRDLQCLEALSTDSMVHGADNDGLLFTSIVFGKADVAFVDLLLKLVSDAVSHDPYQ